MDAIDVLTPPLDGPAMEAMLDKLLKQWLYRAMEQQGVGLEELAAAVDLDRATVAASLLPTELLSAARLHLLAGGLRIGSAELMHSLPSLTTLRGDLAIPPHSCP